MAIETQMHKPVMSVVDNNDWGGQTAEPFAVSVNY